MFVRMYPGLFYVAIGIYALSADADVHAQPEISPTSESVSLDRGSDMVEYPPGFFRLYRPNTALDMVEQLPGFRPDDGLSQRGYGGSVGNILINGRRPASKSDSPTDLLDRIPSSQVAHIELIRSPTNDIELLGKTEVVNVVLLDEVPAAIRWETSAAINSITSSIPLQASISMSDLWRGIDYNAGMDIERGVSAEPGEDRIFTDEDDLLELRSEEGVEKGVEGSVNFSASTWIGETWIQLNSQFGMETRDEDLVSRREQYNPSRVLTTELFEEESDEIQYELGINVERSLRTALFGRLILLYNAENEDGQDWQRSIDQEGVQSELRQKEGEQKEAEAIARVEFEWSAISDHLIRLNLETAWNLLDNYEIETEDSGSGSQTVDVPGANTRIEELRWDILLKDTWSTRLVELEYGIAAEISTISQTGDAELKRNFIFLKPHLVLTRAGNSDQQLRLRLARDVAQLDFSDFVSATDFEDDEVSLGNPNLRPERFWIAELGYEHRFGNIGMIGTTLYHHWIDDVEDLLPLTETEEVPGNIGNGRRWGVTLEGTLPLEWIGLIGSRLDMNARWQNSTVTDPVTGTSRVLSAIDDEDEDILSANNEYSFAVRYRQDFEAARLGWGAELEIVAERPRFKVNELDIRDEGAALDLFVETTRWKGLKIRLEANNLLNQVESRDRIIYSGLRRLSPLEQRQLGQNTEGRELLLSLSGTF